MAAQYAIMRFAKYKGPEISGIEAHNERTKEQYASNPDIDISRSHLNFHLVDPPGKYCAEAERQIAEVGCRTRTDSVRLVEMLVTASPEFFKDKKRNGMKITYTRKGDYLFPDLVLPESDYQIGKYGMLRETYLKEHRAGWYTSMLLSGKLDKHLAEIDLAANERFDLIVNQMKKAERVTEKLKAEDQFLWIQKMGDITSRAEEIVLQELIYV